MSDWIDRILTGLRSESLPDREDAAMWAASLFQIFTGAKPFDPSVDPSKDDLDASVVQELSDVLERDVRANPAAPDVGSMVWALGKRLDPGLRSVFALALGANLHGDPNTLHQALIALDNLEEPALADAGFFSAYEVERNRRLAYAVLCIQPADISMCLGRDCAEKGECLRFSALPLHEDQSIGNFDERRGESCDFFWEKGGDVTAT